MGRWAGGLPPADLERIRAPANKASYPFLAEACSPWPGGLDKQNLIWGAMRREGGGLVAKS